MSTKKYITLDQALEVLDRQSCYWAAEYMKLIPAADVRPVVRGKWEDEWAEAADPHDRRCFRCSSCRTIHAERTNYCPNCGADMREEYI